MEMAAPVPVIFSRGFRFNPTPLEAATYYLPRLVAGAPLHEAVRPVVNHADVYGCEPGDLARQFCPLPRTGHRFFFTHCKLQQPQRAGKASRATRVAGSGSWHSQSVKDVVDHAGVKVGEIRKLRYKKGGEYTDWLMDEYSCCLEDAVAGDKQFVLCNIYVSPRADQGSAARQESAAFFAPPAPAPVVILAQAAAAPKRPAPQSAEPPCPKRMRGAVAPTPPVVQPAGYCTASFAPPLPYPYVPHIAASAQPPPPPVPTRLIAPPQSRSPAPTPLQSRSLPKQQAPPPTLSVVRACHMPVEEPARHCQPPQPSEQRKQSTRDPFEAAEQRDEAEEERVAAPVDEDDDWAELEKCMDDAVPTAEGSTMSEDEMDQHLSSLLFEEEEIIPDAIAAPDPASKGSKSALQDDLDLFHKILDDTLRRSSSTMAI
ncbi:phosphatase and actin regulator 4B-like [Setaria italica]|nr:phosphatase and actin regulator 4B-like [Setaria italica]XP_022679748.1 phosphatase and actin regulator 4B-like [Setaria italica]XP_022679749.1 phosphatase and actin regulator 4B-like [Setaria italica]